MKPCYSVHILAVPLPFDIKVPLYIHFVVTLQFKVGIIAGFYLRILVAGERCNVTGEYFERGSSSE